MKRGSRALALFTLMFASACATRPTPPPPVEPPIRPVPPPPLPPPPVPTPAPAPIGANAREVGIALAQPRVLARADAERALAAFKISCGTVSRRAEDVSRLTRPADWRPLCAEAASLAGEHAAGFFYHRFDWVRVGNGEAFATGYYEPEIPGSRVRAPGFDVPIYRKPADLIRCTRADGGTGRGRIDPLTGQCVLYFTRAEIDDGALAGRGLELAWAADSVDLFFLQIQGSGRVRMADGSVIRIGYADQNGREYVAIGRLLRERGILPPGGADMQSIRAWMSANPEAGRALMRENWSYIFFRELSTPPLGSLGVPVSPRASVAVDPLFVPYGAPAFLTLDRPEANGLWIAQDTGGAIKGANRFDTFWGGGEEATRIAGGMSSSGQALILLPKGRGTQPARP